MKIKYIAAVLIAIAGLGLQQAKADIYSFDLSVGNPGISGFSGPYANVTVNLVNSTTATITFTSLTNSGNIYLLGDGSSVALNVNASSFSVGGISGTNAGGGSPGPYTFAGAGNVDGFGVMNLTINSFDGFSHAADSITFTLTNTSGSWANAMAVLLANGNGTFAAAHIFVAAIVNGQYVNLNATGYAGNGGAFVPDGGTTVMLLGAALGALGMARRFLRR